VDNNVELWRRILSRPPSKSWGYVTGGKRVIGLICNKGKLASKRWYQKLRQATTLFIDIYIDSPVV
jgi:hypothetical protein